MNCEWFSPKRTVTLTEPSLFELGFHWVIGTAALAWDGAKRALFEFLPLAWLQAYRENARWLFTRHNVPERKSFREQVAAHWGTISTCYLMIAGTAVVHSFLNPRFTFLPFYLIPCAMLAIVINRRWATMAAIVSACVGPTLLGKVDSEFARVGIIAWNTTMRFLLLEVIILLFDRARLLSISSRPADPDSSAKSAG